MQLLQVGLVALGRRLDGFVAGVPVGRADLAVLVGELEGVEQAERLVDAAADWQIVDGDLEAGVSRGFKCTFPRTPIASDRCTTAPTSPLTHLSDDAVRVDDEQAAQRNALLLDQDAVVLAQLVVLVAQQRDVDAAQAAVFPACIRPGQQAVLAIRAREDDLGAPCSEIAGAVAEGDDLGRAYEGPRHGHEAEDEPLLSRRILCEAAVCGVPGG